MSDRPGVPIYEPPPPRLRMVALVTVGLNIAALIAILLGYCDPAAILILLAILLGGYLFIKLNLISSKQPADHYEPPPP